MTKTEKVKKLKSELEKIYSRYNKKLLFHGWHHVNFVWKKSIVFAKDIKADVFLAQSAALTHDLNYIVKRNFKHKEGKKLRKKILTKCFYTDKEVDKIESIILEAATVNRNKKISKEAKALSDADTLYRALPITPILFTNSYLKQTGVSLETLTNEIIVKPQNKLMKSEIYFFTDIAKKKYLNWAKTNLELWNNASEALKDDDVKEVLRQAKKYKII